MNMKNLMFGYLSALASKPNIIAKGMGFIAILFVLYCCTPKISPPTETDVDYGRTFWSDCSLEKLTEARNLYIKKCGGCHALKSPQSLTEEKWRKILPAMTIKAKLNPAQHDLLLNYILTMRQSMLQPKK